MRPFWLYVVICQKPSHFYVGITQNYSHRYWQHVQGDGSEFTRKYGVLRMARVQRFWNADDAKAAELNLVETLSDFWPGSHVAGAGRTGSGCCP